MNSQNIIKVIKRAERERLEQQTAGSANSESRARGKSREMAATVRGWVGELRQSRPARYREFKQRLGWSEDEGK